MYYACKSIDAFYSLVSAGLFLRQGEGFVVKSHFLEDTVWDDVYRLAEEQSVMGLMAEGIGWFKVHDSSFRVPQEWSLRFIGQALQIEHRNMAMNEFVADLVDKLRKQGIHPILVKGQGIAQCYENPLWRVSGDVDFYMNEADFQRAKTFFRPLVDKFDPDDDYSSHVNMHYGEWVVEIHANQKCTLSPRIDRVMAEVHDDIFCNENKRDWTNNGTHVSLPSADNDAIIIFTHFLNHFYKGGIGLRQICDWCRLLWSYHGAIDLALLEKRIRKAGLLDTWRAFGAFAVKYLGMPIEAMPLYIDSMKWKKKADKISEFILEVGNFGHNRDTSYYGKYPFLVRKAISFGRRLKDLMWHTRIFPLDSVRFLFGMTMSGLKAASHGE